MGGMICEAHKSNQAHTVLEKEGEMSDLVVVCFDDQFKAEEVRLDLLKMQRQHLTDLEDAVVLVRNQKGTVKLHHMTHLTLEGAVTGGFLGTLFGLILLNPVFALFGLAAGTVIGALEGSLTHLGIDEHFMKGLAENLKSGTSALCILVRAATTDEVLKEVEEFGGKVLETSLLHEDDSKVKAALEAVKEECIKLGYCEANSS
jgi:uncharacterized membrane protein